MKKRWMIFTVVAAVTALASTAFAFGPGGGWGRGHGGHPCYGQEEGAVPGAKQLNLTAEQTDKIKALREAHLKDIKPLHDKMFSKRGELRLLWLQTSPDQAKITVVQKEIRTLRDQLEDQQISHRLAIFNVLTPEQRTKAQAFAAGRGMMGGGHFAGGPGGPKFGPGPGACRNW